jgi:hypothetical protein
MSALLPAESMALTVARAQVERGENPPFSTTTMLVLALDRLTGRSDWTAESVVIDGQPVEGAECQCPDACDLEHE